MSNLLDKFKNIRVFSGENGPSLHKPLLVLLALGKVYHKQPRLISFRVIDTELRNLLRTFHLDASQHLNTHYPFGKLENDGIWEIANRRRLRRTSVGHLYRSQLIEEDVHGGFTKAIYDHLFDDHDEIMQLSNALADTYFSVSEKKKLFSAVGLSHRPHTRNASGFFNSTENKIAPSPTIPPNGVRETMTFNNDFIIYINSLHNLRADGTNALAESQAINPFFGDLYEPFPLASDLKALLQDPSPRVVILSGHAGDGKSTVALDIYKALSGLPPNAPLTQPLGEHESIQGDAAPITIVKDMSELGIDQRRQHLAQAFGTDSGSWLIVSNTGPLLTSLSDYARQQGLGDIEDRLLTQLDQPLLETRLHEHFLGDFGKPLHIINLTRFDNTEVGSRVLTRLIDHPAWSGCDGCSVQPACPIARNRAALHQCKEQVEERVRWLYRRVTEYDQRLTLRQMVAQLAFGITGGLGCADVKASVGHTSDSETKAATQALGEIIFSEGFFGLQAGHPRPEAMGLRAVSLFRATHIGGPVSPHYERQLQGEEQESWATLPETLAPLANHWRKKTDSPPKRAALRRMLLIYGQPRPGREEEENAFIDGLLRSPGLRLLDASRCRQDLALSRMKKDDLLDACLGVLREAFTGFAASQFHRRDDQLYLTLRRPDRAVVQPTQLVVGSLSFRDFFLEYDPTQRTPLLIYQRGRGGERVELTLSLPLLDYILRRADGELGAALAPIHQAQLDNFQAKLLRLEDAQLRREGEITLLRADISGVVDVYNYLLDQDGQRLVKQR